MSLPFRHLDRIRRCFPQLEPSVYQVNRDGLMNTVVILDERWVYRYANHELARQTLHREAKLLDLVHQHVALQVPHFTWAGDDAVVYPFIPGIPLTRNRLLRSPEAIQEHLAAQLGTFLHQLHTLPLPADAVAAGVSAPGERTKAEWQAELERVQEVLFPHLWLDQKQWVAELFGPVLDGTIPVEFTPALVHGDLVSYHILVDLAVGSLNGIIDFGAADIGDPADDLAAIIITYGEQFLRRMGSHYPNLEQFLDRARFLAHHIELWWLMQGFQRNDPSWFVVHIGRAGDVMPYGWRTPAA